MVSRCSVPLLIAVVVITIVGCGGGSAGTNEAAGGPARQAVAERSCDETAADGAIDDVEIGLSTTEESLDLALERKKTVVVTGGPAGVAHIRTRSKSIFEAIHRELNEIRKILRSC